MLSASSAPAPSLQLRDGRTLTWQCYGDDAGRPLLVFHGFPGCHVQAALIGDAARRAGVRLIAPDRPGFAGSTPDPDRTILSWVRDVEQLAAHLSLLRFGVLGISCGGAYALACAHEIGERLDYVGLVAGMGPMDVPAIRRGQHPALKVLFGLSRLHPRLVTPMLRMDQKMFGIDPMRALQRLASMMTAPDQAFLRTHVAEAETFARSLSVAYRQGIDGAMSEAALIARPRGFELADIRIPVHVYQGGHDRNVPPDMGEYIARHIKLSRYRFFPDEGHLSIVSNAADEYLEDFVASPQQ
ncbi:alpha/beta fold hydrolase [Lysobacter niastensis]|uniref:Alpha/beta fold hydrolase n=2 Tax=Lysobacter niastensis TaxID=380629 RepID=A0ABS0B2X7_9GAMM|nr:alpha/beta fold hydrolase [Lysobacter niastensis]